MGNSRAGHWLASSRLRKRVEQLRLSVNEGRGLAAREFKRRIGGYTRRNMLMEVTCRCGWTTRGSKSEVIANIQAHGKSEHGLEVTPDEIRAVWRVVRDDEAPAHRSDGRQ